MKEAPKGGAKKRREKAPKGGAKRRREKAAPKTGAKKRREKEAPKGGAEKRRQKEAPKRGAKRRRERKALTAARRCPVCAEIRSSPSAPNLVRDSDEIRGAHASVYVSERGGVG